REHHPVRVETRRWLDRLERRAARSRPGSAAAAADSIRYAPSVRTLRAEPSQFAKRYLDVPGLPIYRWSALIMEWARRFIFHGNAAAFGGHIIRPKDIVLEATGASSLPVTGGRSIARIPRTQFDEFFAIDSASTFAEGLFEDRHQFLALTNHQVEEQALRAV